MQDDEAVGRARDYRLRMPKQPPRKSARGDGALARALALVRDLRARCPWDRAQTRETLRPYLVEEALDLDQALKHGEPVELRDELGDLLLHLAFQIVVGEEKREFDAETVTRALEEKMWRRHPKLFGDSQTSDHEGWERMKKRERGAGSGTLRGLPPSLPPLLRAYRLQERAAGVGFDWPDAKGPMQKVKEEIGELEVEMRDAGSGMRDSLQDEIGDLLFAVVNLARKLAIDPRAARRGHRPRWTRRARQTVGRGEDSVLVGIELLGPRHHHDERMQDVQHLHGRPLRREDLGEPAVHVRAFVRAAAAQHDALLRHPLEHHLTRNGAGLRDLATARALPRRGRAAHHPTRAVHRRIQRARLQVPHLGRVRRDALDDHGVVTHGASHEPFLARKGRRRTLAHDIEGLAAVLLTPGEVVMVVNQLLLPPAEQLDHFARDPLAPGVGVASGQVHELPVGVPHRARDVEQGLALRHALAPRAVLPERKKAVRYA